MPPVTMVVVSENGTTPVSITLNRNADAAVQARPAASGNNPSRRHGPYRIWNTGIKKCNPSMTAMLKNNHTGGRIFFNVRGVKFYSSDI